MLVINLIFFLVFFLVLTLISVIFFLPEYKGNEITGIGDEVVQFNSLIMTELEALDLYCRDWAFWTDTWKFVRDRNPEYIASNLGKESLGIGDLDFFLFVNRSGELVFASWIEPETLNYSEHPVGVVPVEFDTLSFDNFDGGADKAIIGIIKSVSEQFYYMFSSRIILKSDMSGPAAGTLVAGRILDESMLLKLSEMIQHEIYFTESIDESYKEFFTPTGVQYYINVNTVNKNRLWSIAVPVDILRQDSPVFFIYDHEINTMRQGVRMISIMNLIIIIAFLLLLGMQQVWVMRAVVSPISDLNRYIKKQNSVLDEGLFLDPDNENEIDRLSLSFHFLFNKLFEKNRELFFQANTDALPGVSRRPKVMELLKDLCSINQSGVINPFCVFMIDIDHFKKINDTYGHAKGDEVLRGIGPLMKSCLRERDIIGRYGGEEFILIIQELPAERISPLAERIRKKIEAETWSFDDRITVSIGYAIASPPFIAEEILEVADRNLYTAKNTGRNRVVGVSE